MQNIKWDGKQKQVNYKLQILLTEMEFFTNLKTKKIKSKPNTIKQTKNKTEQDSPEFIDLHLDIINKIDKVIKKNETQSTKKEEPLEKTTLTQIRKPCSRKPKKSLFETDNIQNTFEKNDNLFEVERNPSFNQNIHIDNLTPLSNKVTYFDEPLTVENIDLVEKIDNSPNLVKGLGLTDRNPNKTTKQKSMNVAIAKTDLEKTKQELERRKHELEEIQKLAKEKEEELKKREEEEKKLEKINKIKQKELEKEKRKKEKQLILEQKKEEKINKIKQKELEKEKREEEKINKINQKALEKEKKIKEKQLLLEQKRQEKVNKLEEKKLIKEQEINKKLKEKEEKQKLLAQKEKVEEIIKKNLREKEEKLLSKQEIIEEIELKKKGFQEKPEVKIEVKTKKTDKKIKSDEKINTLLDEEVGQALKIIDDLLEKLPEDTIYEFIHSKDFEIYERVVNKYNKK